MFSFSVDYGKYIIPDMEKKFAALKRFRTAAAVWLPLSATMFGLCFWLVNKYIIALPFLLIGFFGIPFSALAISFLSGKINTMKEIFRFADQIKANEKTFIYQLEDDDFSQLEVLTIVKKLIETGNLDGYSLIANLLVSDNNIYISEKDAKREYKLLRFGKGGDDGEDNLGCEDAEVQEGRRLCPYCDYELPSNANYCSSCGSKLDK